MNHCEAKVWREGADRPCGQVVGLAHWTDTAGTDHAACIWHVRALESRYPIAEPDWLHESKAYADWQESELREAFGG